MKQLKTDIEHGTPLDAAQLEELRQAARVQVAKADAVDRWFKRVSYGVGVSALAALLMLWVSGSIDGGFVGAVVVLAVLWAAAVAAVVVLAVLWAAAVAAVEDGAGVVVAAGIMAGVVVSFLTAAAAGGVVGLTTGVAVAVFVFIHVRLIRQPRDAAAAALKDLSWLNTETHADQCIEYFEWCQNDEVLMRYQAQVAAKERNPVMAEYEASKQWVSSAEARVNENERSEKARVACEKLRVADFG